MVVLERERKRERERERERDRDRDRDREKLGCGVRVIVGSWPVVSGYMTTANLVVGRRGKHG